MISSDIHILQEIENWSYNKRVCITNLTKHQTFSFMTIFSVEGLTFKERTIKLNNVGFIVQNKKYTIVMENCMCF